MFETQKMAVFTVFVARSGSTGSQPLFLLSSLQARNGTVIVLPRRKFDHSKSFPLISHSVGGSNTIICGATITLFLIFSSFNYNILQSSSIQAMFSLPALNMCCSKI